MFLECVVDIVSEIEIELPAAAASLCAAVIEGARNENRPPQTNRARFSDSPARLHSHFVEKLLAEHAGIGCACDVFGLILRIAMRCLNETADTEIVLKSG